MTKKASKVTPAAAEAVAESEAPEAPAPKGKAWVDYCPKCGAPGDRVYSVPPGDHDSMVGRRKCGACSQSALKTDVYGGK